MGVIAYKLWSHMVFALFFGERFSFGHILVGFGLPLMMLVYGCFSYSRYFVRLCFIVIIQFSAIIIVIIQYLFYFTTLHSRICFNRGSSSDYSYSPFLSTILLCLYFIL